MQHGPAVIPEDARERGRLRHKRFWLVVALCWLLWGGIYAVYLEGVKDGATPAQVLRYAYSDAILWALATPLVWWLARRFPVRRPRLLATLGLHALLAPTVATTVLLLDALQDHWFTLAPREPWNLQEFVIHSLSFRLYSNLLIYFSLVAIGHVLDHQRRLLESERNVGVLRALLAEARLSALRTQLQPHFLFNCLNTISGLVEVQPREARRMIGLLSELLRQALQTPPDETIPLRDELRFVQTYLALEKVRFGERLTVDLEVSPACDELQVPAILLQPLVENAVRHGLSSKARGGRVGVRARREGERLELRVDDDGIGLGAGAERGGVTRTGIGLSSVRARLRELYGENHTFTVGPRRGGGTEIAISIPVATPLTAH